MVKISDEDAKILHQRAVTAAASMIDAEVRHSNGQLDEIYYRSFKMYFEMKTVLDIESAKTDIDYELSSSETELETFIAAWKKAAPHALELAATKELLQDHLHHGVVPIYAFNKQDYTPVAVILCLAQGIGLPFLIREPYYVYPFEDAEKYTQNLYDAADVVLEVLNKYFDGI